MADYQPTSGTVISLGCIVCGERFTYVTKAKGRYARFCSVSCRTERSRRVIDPINCKTCGEEFRPQHVARSERHRLGLYCSLACRPQSERLPPIELRANNRGHNQRSRARCKGAEIVLRIDDRDIFERDGWRCGICGDPVDPTLKAPHHYAVCIDHIVPLAKGGQHTPENIQCAHWICNSRKGDKLLGPTGVGAIRSSGP
jgi:5-methylcytosine-specific restriction endonuclease McrA